VTKDQPEPVDDREPFHVANAVKEMGLEHVVITSVTRDDLPDGGAGHFARTIEAVRTTSPDITIEVLIPDFKGSMEALTTVMEASPDILNHNVETVPGLYDLVRPMADFDRSIELLTRAKQIKNTVYTKSGFMVGLGETREQVSALLMRLQQAGCDMVTIGQYLQPSALHYKVREYVHPDVFLQYKEEAIRIGIPCAVSGPLVRSSYHAKEDYMRLQQL